MNTRLPEPLASYYETVNARAVESTLALFAEDGVVRDEGEEHRGRAAIRAWIESITAKYGPITVEPTAVAEQGREKRVTTTVSGPFKGSPVSLRYAFVLEQGRIVRLEIA
jgi:ketosteroid isomerase-like protein